MSEFDGDLELPKIRDERDIARISASMLTRRSFLHKAALFGAVGAVGSLGGISAAEAATRASRSLHPATSSLGKLRVSGPAPSWNLSDVAQGSGAIDTPVELQLGVVNGVNHNIDFKYVGSASQPGQGQLDFVAGDIDTTSFGPSGAAIAALQGYDIVIAGPSLLNHSRWIVRGGSKYKTVADLKGKTVATTLPSSDTYRAIKLALATIGLDFETDFQVVTGSPVANLALFERNGVDAYIAIEPTATELVGGGAYQICTTGQLWERGTGSDAQFFLNGPSFYRSFANSHQKLVEAYTEIQFVVNDYVKAHPEITQKYAAWYGISKTAGAAAFELLPKRLPIIYGNQWDESVTADIDLQIQWGVKEGIIKSTPPKKVYTTWNYQTAT
jgi:NitT/TauT family transport system substrate-binding protein